MTFGGAVLVQGETGMLISPMGMLTQEKAIQSLCCPGCLQVAFTYTGNSAGRTQGSLPLSSC